MKSTTIKIGDQFLINHSTSKPGSGTMPELATVIEIKRNLIKLRTESGETINMMR